MIKRHHPLRLTVLAGAFVLWARPAQAGPVNLIIDTDLGYDVDDAGALAVANKLADFGEVNLLAIGFATSDPNGAAAINAINTYYGRSQIPIGTCKDHAYPCTTLTGQLVTALAQGYPNSIYPFGAPDVVSVYRQILASQPRQSVTFCSIGPVTNLANLLDSGPDAYSNLSGAELVADRVTRLVAMYGTWNDSSGQPDSNCSDGPMCTEFNAKEAPTASARVTSEWPTPIVYDTYYRGNPVQTAGQISTMAPSDDPVRKAYEIYFNGIGLRSSWDPTAVLIASRGLSFGPTIYYGQSALGKVQFDPNLNVNLDPMALTTSFIFDSRQQDTFLTPALPDNDMANTLNALFNAPAYSGPNHVVSRWTFDGTLNDATGGNNGTLTGSGFYTAGRIGRGLYFDGSADSVTISSGSNLALQSFTISAWVKLSVLPSHWATIIDHDRGGNDWYGLWKSANANTFNFRWSANGMADFRHVIAQNVWYHVVGTYTNGVDGAPGTARLYLNGTLDSLVSTTAAPAPVISGARIGQNMDGNEAFPGVIDDLRIYNYALSDAEVADLYANPGLVSRWSLDGNAADPVGDNNGTRNGGTYVIGQTGDAFAFSGGSDSVTVAPSSSLGLTGFTVSAWVELSGLPSGWATIVEHDRWNSDWYGLWKSANGNKFHFRWSPGGSADFRGSIGSGIWYHVVGTYSNGMVSLYLNGSLDSTVTSNSPPVAETAGLRIGQNMDGGEEFPGTIADVRVYSYALSAAEVANLYTSTGLVGQWTFDNDVAPSVYDSVSANNGTLSGGTYVSEDGSEALSFNGSTDHVDVPGTAMLGATSVSISAWVRLSNLANGWATIVEHDRWNSNWYGLWKSADGKMFHFRWSPTGSADFQSTILANTWYHVVGTYSNGTARLYLNGNLDFVTTGSAPVAEIGGLRIGQNLDGGEGFPGMIDDVRIYNYALSYVQVQQLFYQNRM